MAAKEEENSENYLIFMSGGSNLGSELLSRAEKERSLDHTWITAPGHILSPPGSTGVGKLEFQGS